MTRECTNCGYTTSTENYTEELAAGFWSLRDYHNISGNFCGPCYDKVSHNSYGKPDQPGEYIAILLKQQAVS
jgi:hypothetical protein